MPEKDFLLVVCNYTRGHGRHICAYSPENIVNVIARRSQFVKFVTQMQKHKVNYVLKLTSIFS